VRSDHRSLRTRLDIARTSLSPARRSHARRGPGPPHAPGRGGAPRAEKRTGPRALGCTRGEAEQAAETLLALPDFARHQFSWQEGGDTSRTRRRRKGYLTPSRQMQIQHGGQGPSKERLFQAEQMPVKMENGHTQRRRSSALRLSGSSEKSSARGALEHSLVDDDVLGVRQVVVEDDELPVRASGLQPVS